MANRNEHKKAIDPSETDREPGRRQADGGLGLDPPSRPRRPDRDRALLAAQNVAVTPNLWIHPSSFILPDRPPDRPPESFPPGGSARLRRPGVRSGPESRRLV